LPVFCSSAFSCSSNHCTHLPASGLQSHKLIGQCSVCQLQVLQHSRGTSVCGSVQECSHSML
jgi:hypothetical protein